MEETSSCENPQLQALAMENALISQDV